MLSLLRTNQNLVTLLVLPYIIILHLPVFVYPQTWEPASPGLLSHFIYDLFGKNSVGIRMMVILLIFAEAYLLNRIILKHRLAKEYNLFPGLFFALIACSLPEFLFPAPAHFANLFLILGVSELLQTYRKNNCADKIFNTGLWISIASCLYLPYSFFILLGLFGFNLMRALKVKELFIFLSGFLVPYILIGAYMFSTGQISHWYQTHFLAAPGWFGMDLFVDGWAYIKFGWLMSLAVIAFLSYSAFNRRVKLQPQKKINVFYWTLALALVAVWCQAEASFAHFLLLAMPLSVFLALNFTNLRPQIAEILHLFLFLAVLFLQHKEWILQQN